MQQLKKLLDFYINSSLHVGLAVVAYTKILSFSQKEQFPINWYFFVFFASVTGYNILKYFTLYFPQPKRFIQSHSGIFWITLLSFFATIYSYTQLETTSQINLLFSGLLFFLYPFCRKKWYLKTFTVALCVTLLIFTPLKVSILEDQNRLLFLKFFLFIMASLIPFEIVDYSIDEGKLQTIPQKIGIQKTKIMGYFLVICFLLTNLFVKKNTVIDTLIGGVLLVAISNSTTKKSKYYTSFWCESIPIVWWILLLISKK